VGSWLSSCGSRLGCSPGSPVGSRVRTAGAPLIRSGNGLLIWLLARGTRMMRGFFSVFPGHSG
jgi:hypothetical protein